jgi:hypothetical protein
MLKFTKPQLGDPKQHKSQIADQVRRHAAKVAAVRSKKGKVSAETTADNSPASSHESCFHIGLDSETEELRRASMKTIQSGETTTSDGQLLYRPRWTAVYKLNRRTKASKIIDERASDTSSTTTSQSQSPSTDSDLLSLDLGNFDGELWNLSRTDSQDNTAEQCYNFPVDSDIVQAWSLSSSRSLVAAGKHMPDVPATALAFELGSGFQHLKFLPPYILEALKTSIAATVALDQVARGAIGAPLLEDIVEAAQSSQGVLQNIAGSSMTAKSIEELLIECCCWAALIYGELILCPSSQENHLLLGLLHELQSNLEIIDFWLSGEENLGLWFGLLLWATSLGAIAAGTISSGENWFVQRLASSLYCCPELQDWREFLGVVTKFLWWKPFCNSICKVIWKSAVLAIPRDVEQGSPL